MADRKPRSANRTKRAGFVAGADVLAMLQDPQFQQRRLRDAEERERNRRAHEAATEGLMNELRAAGWRVASLQDLLCAGRPYPGAVPILVGWLHRTGDPRVKESIVRALTMPWAVAAADTIAAQLADPAVARHPALAWAMGNALEVLAHQGIREEMLRIAEDRRLGSARQMVVMGLGRVGNADVVRRLLRLLDDPQVAGHAVIALGRLRAKEASARLERMAAHPKPWIRKEVKKALRRIAGA